MNKILNHMTMKITINIMNINAILIIDAQVLLYIIIGKEQYI